MKIKMLCVRDLPQVPGSTEVRTLFKRIGLTKRATDEDRETVAKFVSARCEVVSELPLGFSRRFSTAKHHARDCEYYLTLIRLDHGGVQDVPCVAIVQCTEIALVPESKAADARRYYNATLSGPFGGNPDVKSIQVQVGTAANPGFAIGDQYAVVIEACNSDDR